MSFLSGETQVLLMAISLLFVLAAANALPRPNYEISNATKKKSANTYMEIAADSLSRTRGLMFRGRIIPILFIFDSPGNYPIHSHFVKSEFDAVYLSQEGRVAEIFRKVPPNTNIVSPKKEAAYLLELPPEIFDKLQIEGGDLLVWKETGKR